MRTAPRTRRIFGLFATLALLLGTSPSNASEPPDGAWDAAAVQALNGAVLGLYICEAGPECWGDAEEMSMLVGALSGGVLGYVIGSQFPRQHVMMVNTGMIAGHFVGIATADLAIQARRDSDDWDYDRDAIELQHRVIGELLGGAAMGGLSVWLNPRPAQVSMANSGGMWALWLAGTAQVARDRTPGLYGSMATFGFGFAGGWLLWEELGLTRLSMWKIDLGGVVGAVAAGIYDDAQRRSQRNTPRTLMIGTVLGLAAGTWLAWGDKPDPQAPGQVAMSVAPQPGGGLLTIAGTF